MIAVVVMGVCGCGKSTLATKLAETLGGSFIEGDELHSDQNVAKMASGQPLNDEDRWPWLAEIGRTLSKDVDQRGRSFAACSALKKSYRDHIRQSCEHAVIFLYLKGEKSLIEHRMSQRKNHYMPTSLIESQFAILEEPQDEEQVIPISIDQTPDAIAKDALCLLERLR